MGGPWEDYGGTSAASAEHGPWEDYGATPSNSKRSVASPLAPPPVPRPQVNMQPMSVSDVINTATGHPDYQAPVITPVTIAKGTAHDVGTLTRAGYQAMVKGITGKPLIGEPPPNKDIINAAANIGQGYLLGGIEAAERPSIPRTQALPEVPREQPTPMQQLPPEQFEKVQAQIDKANKPFVKYQQAQDIAAQKQQNAAVIQQEIKTRHAEVYGGLQQRADAFREASANVTRPINGIVQTIETGRSELSGVPADLRVFRDVMQHLQDVSLDPQAKVFAERLVEGVPEEQAAQGLPPSAEVPLIDLQRQYTALSNAWADSEGNVKRVLGDVRNAYARELQAGADSIGQGKAWSQLQKDWSQYYKDWRGTGPLAKVLKAPHPDYVTPIVTGRPGNLLRETYARYGDPQAIARLQQLTNPPPPPLAEIQLPPPAPPEPTLGQRIISHIPRVAGKIIGGKIGTAVGHPLIGYGLGGEVGGEIGRKLTQPKATVRPLPPTPEAYTRTILEAKEGKISPGEADRRIVKMGGKVRVKPIPQAPVEEPE